jgi:Metallo-beta-lactamase superfamily
MAVADEFQQINEHLFFWQAYEPAVKCDLSCSALLTDDGLVFIDPILLVDEALEALTRFGRPTAILLTNGNHARDATWYRKRFNIPIYASAEAALELQPDTLLHENEIAPGGLRVVSLPGAGPGELAYIHGETACIGDALIHLPKEGFAMLPAKYCCDAKRLPNDLKKLLSYRLQILTFAHGTPLVAQATQRLTQLLS